MTVMLGAPISTLLQTAKILPELIRDALDPGNGRTGRVSRRA
jgi:hypothetical protein